MRNFFPYVDASMLQFVAPSEILKHLPKDDADDEAKMQEDVAVAAPIDPIEPSQDFSRGLFALCEKYELYASLHTSCNALAEIECTVSTYERQFARRQGFTTRAISASSNVAGVGGGHGGLGAALSPGGLPGHHNRFSRRMTIQNESYH